MFLVSFHSMQLLQSGTDIFMDLGFFVCEISATSLRVLEFLHACYFDVIFSCCVCDVFESVP